MTFMPRLPQNKEEEELVMNAILEGIRFRKAMEESMEICVNCGGHIFETDPAISEMEEHKIYSHLEDNKCDDPLTREEEQADLRNRAQTNPHVQKCVGCKNLTMMYSDSYPWCCECERDKDISAYNWITRGDDSDRY